MHELEPGRIVAGFVIKERLGKGGMGEVYLVHDQKLRVDRALKVIGEGFDNAGLAQAKVNRERFLREARMLARLRHPHIIPVHEVGEIGGHPFIVMSYFPALDGRKWLRNEDPDAERLRKIAIQIAGALAHAHEQGVLHRDIKLTNILIGKDDEAMLIDFGLAKSKTCAKVTQTGRAMGTFNYMAPEYVRASREGGGAHTELTDLWAFGCLLYGLTCRRPAFDGENDIQVLNLIEAERFTPVKTARPEVPAAWAQFIHQLMQPDPAKRITTARAALEKLEAVSLSAAAMTPPALSAIQPENANAFQEGKEAVDVIKRTPPSDAERRSAPGYPCADESLFDHDDEPAEVTKVTAQLEQPSFRAPVEAEVAAKSRARKSLLLPIAAAAAVLAVGGTAIVWVDNKATRRPARTRAEYVDPEESRRQQRAERELADLSAERTRRAPPSSAAATPLMPVDSPTRDSQPSLAAIEPRPEPTFITRDKPRGPRERASVVAHDPWARRYGSRTSFNWGVSAADSRVTASSAPPSVTAGVKIPVRVRDAIAGAPAGPVIAIVERPTKVGDIELPKGAELHGRTVGTSGPRILVEFTFAIADGRSLPLNGIAVGIDGRAGVPGSKSMGGVSDIAAVGASGGVLALVDIAASASDSDVIQQTIRGAGAQTAGKMSLLNNEEKFVETGRGTRFFVYVHSSS